jgi:hypothetical protein
MKWVTREKVKVDRVACPWLIQKFVDPDPTFLFVPKEEVLVVAKREGAIPFDTPGAELHHYQEGEVEYVSFDAVVRKYKLRDPAVLELAKIVRAADGGGPVDAPEGAGLAAAASGFRATAADDHENLRLQFPLYDALFAYCQEKVARASAGSGPG